MKMATLTPAERFAVLRIIQAADAALTHVADSDRAEALADALAWAYRSLPVAMDLVRAQGGRPLAEFTHTPGSPYGQAICDKRWREIYDATFDGWQRERAQLLAKIAELEADHE